MLDTSKVDINPEAGNEKEKEETEPKDKEDNTSLDEMVIDENFDTEIDNNTGIFFTIILAVSLNKSNMVSVCLWFSFLVEVLRSREGLRLFWFPR